MAAVDSPLVWAAPLADQAQAHLLLAPVLVGRLPVVLLQAVRDVRWHRAYLARADCRIQCRIACPVGLVRHIGCSTCLVRMAYMGPLEFKSLCNAAMGGTAR